MLWLSAVAIFTCLAGIISRHLCIQVTSLFHSTSETQWLPVQLQGWRYLFLNGHMGDPRLTTNRLVTVWGYDGYPQKGQLGFEASISSPHPPRSHVTTFWALAHRKRQRAAGCRVREMWSHNTGLWCFCCSLKNQHVCLTTALSLNDCCTEDCKIESGYMAICFTTVMTYGQIAHSILVISRGIPAYWCQSLQQKLNKWLEGSHSRDSLACTLGRLSYKNDMLGYSI